MKKNKYIGIVMMAAGLLAATSCSDFDDYNKVDADANPNPLATKTLWENIQENAQLSDFAALVKKAGFDKELSQTQYYTVWAPLDGTYDASVFQALDNNALVRQFVKNHIASYAHGASGNLPERVLMLNEKSYDFVAAPSTFKFDEVDLDDANLPNSNGLLHTLKGVATFYPNLYEYVTDSLLAEGSYVDSLRHFFLKNETTYLDTEHSVLGSIVNGMQTYVDSVMVTENTLWDLLNAKIYHEDSTYTFLLPTNEAWLKTYDRIKSCYNYLPTTKAQAFNGANIANVPASIEINNTYFQDSLVTFYLTRNLIYSNNDAYNQWVEGTPSFFGSDTLRSTTFNKLSNPADILAQTKAKLKMSNGVARVVDSLAFYPWETYAPYRTVNAASKDNQARILSGSAQTVRVSQPDPEKVDLTLLNKRNNGTLSYLWINPSGGYAKPELDLYLPNVLSTTYDIYCVFVPQSVELGNNAETLPNRVIFTLNYCDANGNLNEYTFLDESEENISSFQEKFHLADNATYRTTIRGFSNDTSKVDTVYVGEFTFPVCYYGLGDGYCPNIKITSPFSVFNTNLMNSFSRDLRIAGIILKPKELVEFEESNK